MKQELIPIRNTQVFRFEKYMKRNKPYDKYPNYLHEIAEFYGLSEIKKNKRAYAYYLWLEELFFIKKRLAPEILNDKQIKPILAGYSPATENKKNLLRKKQSLFL